MYDRRARLSIPILIGVMILIGGCAFTATPAASLPSAEVTAASGPAAPAGPSDTAPGPSAPPATVAATETLSPTAAAPSAPPAASPLPDAVQRVVELTNQNRAEAGCPPLRPDSRLTRAAERQSRQMAQEDYFAHVSPDGSSPADRVQAEGYDYVLVGENLAAGYASPEAVVESWMESQEHRDNILNCEFEDIGVGHVYVEEDPGQEEWHHYWTQVLGTHASSP